MKYIEDFIKLMLKQTGIDKDIQLAIEKKESGAYPDLPKCVFLPQNFWRRAVAKYSINGDALDDISGFELTVAALTWRYTKGIYRFDEELKKSILESEPPKIMSLDVFSRLPQYCIYIEHEVTFLYLNDELNVSGFFVSVGKYENGEKIVLKLSMISEKTGGSVVIYFNLDDKPITEALLARGDLNWRESIAKQATPLIKLISYICSQEPDINCARTPGESPKNATQTKTKRGYKLFAAPGPKIWDVGKTLGDQIRADLKEHNATGRTVRTHIRKGHWHGYWTGPRTGKREFILKWLNPRLISTRKDKEGGMSKC